MTSQPLGGEKLHNLRDLGGMTGAEGKHIRSGLLLRSEQLYQASESDISLLEKMPLRLVVDFRNPKEAAEKPDPSVNGCEYKHLSIIDDSTLLSWEKDRSEQGLKQLEAADSDAAGGKAMCELYRNFVRTAYSRAQYSRFLQSVMAVEDGAVLWHCTLGKDRCGWGAVLVQFVLGVSKEDILQDYLFTNECLKEEIAGMLSMLQKLSKNTTLAHAGRAMVEARKEYVLAAWEEAEKLYGSMDAFLENGLGVDEAMKQQFRARYLV